MVHKSLRFVVLLALLLSTLPASPATRAAPIETESLSSLQAPAAPAGPIPSGYLWDSDADFAPGAFYNTQVVSGTGRVTLTQTPIPGPNVRVDDAPSGYQYSPSLAVGADGTLYAAWVDSRNGNWDIYFARSTDGGATWSANIRVDDAPSGDQRYPSLAVGADGTLYAAWGDSRNGNADIYFARSTDGGATWSANVRVDDAPSGYQEDPSLVVGADGTLYAAWEDWRNGNSDIYFARSTDGGATWSANIRVDDAPSGYQYSPSLAVGADGTLYAAWVDSRNGNWDIYFARSTDGGATWSANIRVDDAPSGDQRYPSLAVGADGTLYAAWEDSRNGNYDIYFARSTDGGATWSANIRVDDAPSGDQYWPSLAVGADGTLYAAWADTRNGNYDIYFARSTDGGATWSANIRVEDSPSGDQSSPSLAVGADGTLYAAWGDSRNGNDDIYAARWSERHGLYVAAPVDAGARVVWGTLTYTATLPAGTAITLTARVGDSPTPDAHWSDWAALSGSPADLSTLPPARYLQWKAYLTTPLSTTTPALEAVRLTWGNCTNVSGILSSNTTWAAANAPYCVTGNVLVNPGITLTVEPGVTVYISDTRSIQVQGTLVALGTEAQPIRFTSWHPQGRPDDWGGITFADTAVGATFDAQGNYLGGSAFRYVTVEYAGYGSQEYAIQAPNIALYVDHCAIRNNGAGGLQIGGDGSRVLNNTFSSNQGSGVSNSGSNVTISGNTSSGNRATYGGGGVYNSGSNVTISGNTFSGNRATYGGGGVYNSGSNVTISGNTFSGNRAGSGGGVLIDYGSNVTISGNTFFSNQANSGGGVSIYSSSNVTISGNTFSGNQTNYNGGGVYNSGSNVTISGNTFSSNQTTYNGGGVYSGGSNVTISGNTFSGNQASSGGGVSSSGYEVTISGNTFSGNQGGGVWWSGSGSILYNTIVNNTSSGGTGGIYLDSGLPVIRYNALVGNQGYALYNNNGGTTHVDARYNWWGTADDAAIQSLIYDWFDDGNKSIVDYAPYLTSLAADLSASSKSVSPAVVALGERVTYTVRLFNQAPLTATLVYFTDTLPAHVTYVPGSAQGASYSGGTLTWQGGLRPGETHVITFAATVDASAPPGSPITNTAYVSGDGVSGMLALQATFTTACEPVSGASIAVTPAAPWVGQVVTFTGSVGAGSGNIIYTWDFGDGNGAVGRVVTHTYAAAGNYVVGLTAQNECGSTSTTRNVAVAALTRGIALRPGWNLFSLDVQPSDPAITAVLASLAGQYDVVLGFAGGVGQTYDPAHPELSDLLTLDGVHGYWIHITAAQTVTLSVSGAAIYDNTPIPLAAGWNLVSYLPNAALPITEALASIAGQYTRVQGFHDGAGVTYDPARPQFSDLLELRPGHGYWIKMSSSGTLVYPGHTGPLAPGGMEGQSALPAPGIRPALQEVPFFAPTTEWADVYGAALLSGQPVPGGAVIVAYDPAGIAAGAFVVRTAGQFGFLHVYADDPRTPTDEGVQAGDMLHFTLDGRPAVASPPVVWTGRGEVYETTLAVTLPYVATPVWSDFWGAVTLEGGAPAPAGTLLAAYDADGVYIGDALVRAGGGYGFLHAYGDDDSTPADEGARVGDAVTFRAWLPGAQDALYAIPDVSPVVWNGQGQRQQVNLRLYSVLPQAGVDFVPDHSTVARPGEVLTFTHTLTNTGNLTDTFDLSLSGWGTLLTPTPVMLGAGASAPVQVRVVVPADALSGTVNTTVVTATSRFDAAVSAAVRDAVTVYTVPVPPQAGVAFVPYHSTVARPGEVLTFTHTLTNTGNLTDTFDLSLSGWGMLLTPTPVMLGAGASAPVQVRVVVPADALSGTVNTTVVTATSRFDAAVSAAVRDAVTVYTVPVPPQAGVAFVPYHSTVARPGEVLTFTHTLTNTGNLTDTFDLSLSGWGTLLTPTPVMLGAGASTPVQVRVVVPADALSGMVNTTVVTATSRFDAAVSAAVRDTVTVQAVADVALAPDQAAQAQPGEVLTFTHTLTNTGNLTDTFDLSLSGWGTLLTPTPVMLGAGASTPVQVRVVVPADALSGTVNTTVVTATSRFDAAISAAVRDTVTVQAVAGVALAPDQAAQAQPGEVLTFTHTLTNTGNLTDTFDLSLSGWGTLLTPTPVMLGAGASTPVQVRVVVPADALSGTVNTTVVTATSRFSPTVYAVVQDVITVDIESPRYAIFLPLVVRNQ